MVTNKITKKKVKGWLDVVGYNYPGELTYESVHRWLMFFKKYYVMPFPRPYYKWEVMVIILGKPNTQDGKLNMVFLDGKYNSYDEALIGGVEQVLLTLVEAKKDADSHAGDEEWNKELVNELRKNGFDI